MQRGTYQAFRKGQQLHPLGYAEVDENKIFRSLQVLQDLPQFKSYEQHELKSTLR